MNKKDLDMMAYACIPSLWELKAGGSGVQSHLASAVRVLVHAAAAIRHGPSGVCMPVYSPRSCDDERRQPHRASVAASSLSLKLLASLRILSCHCKEVLHCELLLCVCLYLEDSMDSPKLGGDFRSLNLIL